MHRIRAGFAIAGIAFLLASPFKAQTPPTNVTIFTASTELVLVPTVVNDKSGAYMAGLKKEEFALKQDGKSYPIAIFEEVKTDSTRLRRAGGEHGTFSNFEAGSSDYHRLNIIVWDFVNTPFADQANAKNALLKFLSEVAESGEPMCLLALTRGGLTLLHDFTDDPKLLATALRQTRSDNAPLIHEPITEAGQFPASQELEYLEMIIRENLEAEAEMNSMETKRAATVTVQALQQIAKGLRGLPGRKSLIWASSGFPFSVTSPSASTCEPGCADYSSYANVWRLMNDAQISIYSVDLRAAAPGNAQTPGGVRPSDIGDPQFDTDAQAQWKRQDTDSTLQLFAENTGGKAFLGGGNLVESFRQATRDDSSYYMLGYYVSRSAKSGWHQISVTVSRKGAHPRYRNGFFLSRDTSAPSARQDVKLALTSPFDFLGVPVSVTWSGRDAGNSAGKNKMKFDLVMPPNFASVDESDQNHMVVDIAAVAKNRNGDVVAELSQRIDTHLKPDGMEQIQHNGMTYRNELQLPVGEYTVRFVVRDSIGNRTGSVAAPIKVAP
jgi:VWFA-related protein